MLKAKREKLGRVYTIIENDIPIVELKISGWFRRAAELSVEGSTYQLSTEGEGYMGYNLEQNGKVVAFADDSVYDEFPGIILEYRGMRYLLKKESVHGLKSIRNVVIRILSILGGGTQDSPHWRSGPRSPFILLSSNNKRIGSVRTNPKFPKEIIIDLPENWPLSLKVFIFWIVRGNC
ncbi:MAG: hypothetical protein ACYSSP_13915 [Planctomycetota bacterium]|jgi:hypothetical protein